MPDDEAPLTAGLRPARGGLSGTILQISVSRGGIPKRAVPRAVVTPLGIDIDTHSDPHAHRDPEQAILLVSSENIDRLRTTGWPLFYGALGENLTTKDIDFRLVRLGQRFLAGETILEISAICPPSRALDVYGPGFEEAIFDDRAKQGHPSSEKWGLSGFYARVSQAGTIRTNDIITLLDQAV